MAQQNILFGILIAAFYVIFLGFRRGDPNFNIHEEETIMWNVPESFIRMFLMSLTEFTVLFDQLEDCDLAVVGKVSSSYAKSSTSKSRRFFTGSFDFSHNLTGAICHSSPIIEETPQNRLGGHCWHSGAGFLGSHEPFPVSLYQWYVTLLLRLACMRLECQPM